MNILLSNSTDIFAGGEDYVLILAKHLKLRGHAIWVSAHPGHLLLRKCGEAGIDTIPLSYTGMSRVFAVAGSMRTHLRRLDIDVVHSNANYDRTVAGIAAVGLRTRHVASIHSSHSIQHNITHWMRNRWATDHFIADAESVRNVLVTEDRIPPERISVIPIGVEAQPQDEMRRWREHTRASWGVAADTVVIGNVARLVPFKGHRYLIEAVAGIVKTCGNILCVVVGDGELMPDLQKQVRSLNMERTVRFLGFQDNLHELYPAFDVYCHSSLDLEAEAFPLAILRALATGLPVVATRVGGIDLMVRERSTGFLVPPEDAAGLASALLAVVSDRGIRCTMGEGAAGLFRENFHAAAMAGRVEQVYQQLFRGRAPDDNVCEE